MAINCDSAAVEKDLVALESAARGGDNVLYPMKQAFKDYATIGEVFGRVSIARQDDRNRLARIAGDVADQHRVMDVGGALQQIQRRQHAEPGRQVGSTHAAETLSIARDRSEVDPRDTGVSMLGADHAHHRHSGLDQIGHVLDVWRVDELRGVSVTDGVLSLGALTTYTEMMRSKAVREHLPALALVSHEVGAWAIQNRGTLGGSLAQAHPAADYPAAVLALDAEIVAQSRSGERVLPIASFFTGMFSTQLRNDEILTEVRVPRTTSENVTYKKFHHPASGYAVVGVAVRLKMSGPKIDTAAVGITGVSDSAYRATAVEVALRGKPASAIAEAAKQAARGVEIIGDVYASAPYRRHLVTVIARRALEQAASG